MASAEYLQNLSTSGSQSLPLTRLPFAGSLAQRNIVIGRHKVLTHGCLRKRGKLWLLPGDLKGARPAPTGINSFLLCQFLPPTSSSHTILATHSFLVWSVAIFKLGFSTPSSTHRQLKVSTESISFSSSSSTSPSSLSSVFPSRGGVVVISRARPTGFGLWCFPPDLPRETRLSNLLHHSKPELLLDLLLFASLPLGRSFHLERGTTGAGKSLPPSLPGRDLPQQARLSPGNRTLPSFLSIFKTILLCFLPLSHTNRPFPFQPPRLSRAAPRSLQGGSTEEASTGISLRGSSSELAFLLFTLLPVFLRFHPRVLFPDILHCVLSSSYLLTYLC